MNKLRVPNRQSGPQAHFSRSFPGSGGLPRALWPFVLLLVLACAPVQLNAAQTTNAVKGALSSNRYLFIIETSKSMQRRTEGIIKVVQGLLISGMSGQLRRGDTIGVWTFNADLHAGQFPLQQWTPETQRNILQRASAFLEAQPYEKSGRLEKAIASMDQVVKISDVITVILITDGTQRIRGTPFDENINKVFKLWEGEQQKARMPFVTVLRGNKGLLTEHSVTSAPWPVEIPAVPPPPQVAETPAPKPPPVAEPRIVAPLIVTGKKSTAPVPPSNGTPIPQTTPAKPESITTTPAEKTVIEPPPPSQAPLQDNRRATVINESGSPTLAPPPPPANPVTESKPAPINETPTAPKELTPVVANDSAKVAEVTSPNENHLTARAKGAPEDAAITPPPTKQAPRKPGPPSTEVIAIGADPILSQKLFVIGGVVVAMIAIALGLVALRRPKTASSHTSLITRSLDREEKP